MNTNNILVIGTGEIGQGILNQYNEKEQFCVFTKDLDYCDAMPKEINVMHICIPYSQDFTKIVVEEINKYSPKLTIINSTVPTGTTNDIYEITKELIAHSPCVGKHPKITESIKSFTKIIGGTTQEAGLMTRAHFNELGIETVIYNNSNESETAKLFSTTRYGWDIMYMKFVKEYCDTNNLNFYNIYTKTTEIYNDGYSKINMPQYTRPKLEYMGKGIFGHCVKENCKLINKFFPSEVINKSMKEGL